MGSYVPVKEISVNDTKMSVNFTKTIIPLALMASESIAHSAFDYCLRVHSGSRNNC